MATQDEESLFGNEHTATSRRAHLRVTPLVITSIYLCLGGAWLALTVYVPVLHFSHLGLGLIITKGVVELHGGQVTAASAGLGHGSTFTIILPRRHEE